MTIVSPFTDVTLLMYVPTYMKPPGVDIACPLHGVTGNTVRWYRHICSVDAHSFEAFDSCVTEATQTACNDQTKAKCVVRPDHRTNMYALLCRHG